MNARIVRLIQLLEIKKEATNKAYVNLLRVKEQMDQNRMKQDQLVGYKQDYLQQFQDLGKDGASIVRLRNRLNFISHLDMALSQLAVFLNQLESARSRAELMYKQAKIAEEGVSKLIERAKRTEELRLQRIEQKESDEYAQKQWYGKKNNDQ